MATFASDGTAANVQTLHDSSCVDGDTITMPSGTFSWSTTVTITKGITLQGLTTVDSTAGTAVDNSIILDFTSVSLSAPIIKLVTVAGKSYRVTGLTFRTGQTVATNLGPPVRLGGYSASIRVDHCHFNDLQYTNNRILTDNSAFGVIDHNLFDQTTDSGINIQFNCPNFGGSQYQNGDGSWALPTNYGSSQFMFVEDNYIVDTSGIFRSTTDDTTGARWVFRHNHCYNMGIGSHGTEVGRPRGGRAKEIYGNDFHWTLTGGVNIGGAARSGTLITYNNTHNGPKSVTQGFGLTQYRFFLSRNAVFLSSTGQNPWDYNVTESDGVTHIDGNAPYLFDAGVCGAGSQQGTVNDNGVNNAGPIAPPWATNRWADFTAVNPVVQNSGGYYGYGLMLVTGNTGTGLSGISFQSAGSLTGFQWTSGNVYQIYRCLVSMDQACRGAGDLISGSPPNEINTTTGTASWVHQQLDPCYSWNDIDNSSGTNVNVNIVANDVGTVIRENRDFYNQNTAWTPGNPLTTGVGVGTFANRPTSCTAGTDIAGGSVTPGVAYWATDQDTLYVCMATNTWTQYYQPYTYPHPLVSGVLTPVITSPGSATGTVGAFFSYQITATNSPTSFAASPLPAGLSVNGSTGLISGTPTSGGVITTTTLSATNATDTGSKSLVITINNPLAPKGRIRIRKR